MPQFVNANQCGMWDGAMQLTRSIVTIPFFVIMLMVGHSFFLPEALGAGADCPEGISGYWNLDETTAGSYADAIGANNGTCEDGACPVLESGAVVNAGQSFGGSDTITMSTDVAGVNWSAGQSFTIELWMRRSTTGPTSGEEAFIGRTDADTGLNWYIGIDLASGNARAELRASDGSGPVALTVSKDLRSSDDTWHHVALVRDANENETTLYVDGEPSAPQALAGTSDFVSDAAPLTLGSVGGNNFFNGALDEVAIYGRALTPEEIKGHYYVSRGYCDRYDGAVTVMPLGDSITAGIWNRDFGFVPPIDLPAEGVRIGYRYDLWQSLGNNLYQIDYIGSREAGSSVDPDFDPHHAGFLGNTDAQINALLAGGYLTTNLPAEIILLHIGTNGIDIDQSAADVAGILDQVDNFSKNVTVVLAQIIDQVPNDANVTTFNDNIGSMVAGRIAQGDKIILVDMEDLLNYTINTDTSVPNPGGDMYDRFHPNPSGYSEIAGKWFETLETILPQSETPVITSTAITAAAKGELYTYTVTATGPPRPTFELTDNPAPGEMIIDPAGGQIEWTPDTSGDFDVTVRAANWTPGGDTQTFTILVTSRPQASADAFSGVNEGETLTVAQANSVLNNDTDDDNDPLTAVLAGDVTFGTLNLNADGSFTYTHDGTENFNDSFSYRASDGKTESDAVVVNLTITPVDDLITPSSGGGGGGGGCFITALF